VSIRSVSHVQVPHIFKRPIYSYLFVHCLMHPRASHNHVYSFGVTCPKCMFARRHICPSAHIIMRIHSSASHIQVHIQVPHISKCLTCPNVWFPSVSHIQVSHIFECTVSKCLTYPSAWFPSVGVSHISERMASKCPTYPSVWRPSTSHIRVYGVQVPHIFECWA